MTKRNEFARKIKDKIQQVLSVNQDHFPISVQRESTKTLADLSTLLLDQYNDDTEIDKASLEPMLAFLRERYERIHGSEGFYQLSKNAALETRANSVCVYMAQELSRIDSSLQWPGRKPNEILMPSQKQDKTAIERNESLRRYIFSECKNRDEILSELVTFQLAEWTACLADINAGVLKKAFFSDDMPKHSSEMAEISKLFSENSQRNNALLCCLFQIYINDRAGKPEKLSFFGFYNKGQKIAAAKSAQDYIIQGKNVADFHDALRALPGLKEHASALDDGTLKLFKDEMLACALRQLTTSNTAALRVAV
jgi:hypothetical protein